MPAWLALLLGVLQGATEFLPISSSGHLRLVERLFGLEHFEQFLLFDATCHLGTACATCVVLWRDLKTLNPRSMLLLGIATVPLVLATPFASHIGKLGANDALLGWWFLASAALLLGSELFARHTHSLGRRQALCVGAFQALALLPGISRSGSTLTATRLMGVPRKQAARFCFLLSLPAILGATVVQGWGGLGTMVSPLALAIGFLSSAVVGAVVLRLFLSFLEQHTLRPFGWYCLGLGVIILTVLS